MAASTKRTPPPRKARRKRVKPRARPKVPLLRTSERASFNACPWQWDRSYNDRLTPQVEAPALRFGTLVHQALEARYPPGIKRGPKPAITFAKLFDKELRSVERQWGFRDADGEWADAKELGVAMLENYVRVYGKDEEWKVLASEMTFRVPVYLPNERRPLFYYVGTMDGVWESRMDKSILINDYKTTKTDPTKEALTKLVLDEQATAYWTWGVDYLINREILKPRQLEHLNGMLYTFLYKAAPDDRPEDAQGRKLNKDGTLSQKQPVPRFHRELVYRDRDQQDNARERAIQQFLDMEAIRHGNRPVYKTPGLSYPSQQCKACPFFDICELDEIGQPWQDVAKATMTEWDPYDAHEIQEEGKAR
jgi:hypothetical protein